MNEDERRARRIILWTARILMGSVLLLLGGGLLWRACVGWEA